jgi:hypothetical protein
MGVQRLIKKFLKTGSVTNLQKNYSENLPNFSFVFIELKLVAKKRELLE